MADEHHQCAFCEKPAPLTQSLDEVAFGNGLWAVITNGGRLPSVQGWLAKRGRDADKYIDLPDKSGYTPILYASRTGDVELCRFLLDNGAAVSRTTPGLQQSCLQRAASSGSIAVVSLLLERGANPDHRDVTGATALDMALKMDHRAVAELLGRVTTPTAT